MKTENSLESEMTELMLQMSSYDIYKILGPFIEDIVDQQKNIFRKNLKLIWKNRKSYMFKDTGCEFDENTMLIFFNPKKMKSYTLNDFEKILEEIDRETTLIEFTEINQGIRRAP